MWYVNLHLIIQCCVVYTTNFVCICNGWIHYEIEIESYSMVIFSFQGL